MTGHLSATVNSPSIPHVYILHKHIYSLLLRINFRFPLFCCRHHRHRRTLTRLLLWPKLPSSLKVRTARLLILFWCNSVAAAVDDVTHNWKTVKKKINKKLCTRLFGIPILLYIQTVDYLTFPLTPSKEKVRELLIFITNFILLQIEIKQFWGMSMQWIFFCQCLRCRLHQFAPDKKVPLPIVVNNWLVLWILDFARHPSNLQTLQSLA